MFASVLLLSGSAGAQAADGFPGGAFGSRDGCIYAKTGESSGADDFLLLDRRGITTSVSFCALTSAKPSGPSSYALVLACESEGETGGPERAVASRKGESWTVRVEDGSVFGPMRACR